MGKKKKGGLTYYQDFKSNIKNLKPHYDDGYIYEAPYVQSEWYFKWNRNS